MTILQVKYKDSQIAKKNQLNILSRDTISC